MPLLEKDNQDHFQSIPHHQSYCDLLHNVVMARTANSGQLAAGASRLTR